MREKMIYNEIYGASEEKFLKEKCVRENFLNEQDKDFEKRELLMKKLKSTLNKVRDSFSFHKKEEKEVVMDNAICLEKNLSKSEMSEQPIDLEKEYVENYSQKQQEILSEEEKLKIRAREKQSDFIKFVESRLKESNSSELFEVTKDKFDRIIIHAFSQEHSVRKVVKTATKGDYEGLVKVDNGDGIEKCYYHLTYCFEKDNNINSFGTSYSSNDILCGTIVDEEGKVYFLKDEIKIGSQSLVTNIYHKAEKVVADMIKKEKEKERDSETLTF